jgi:hypothetical protein
MAALRMALTEASLKNLQSRIQGTVLIPGDSRYDDARKAWNLSVEQHPAVIVLADSASDVAEAVCAARDAGLGIAVQATGHGVALPANDCLLIITSRMTGVRVDAASRTAWVEGGAKWGAVLEKAQAVGLAPLLGSSPEVSAVGYTLGGGTGWLVRKYGLAVDSVRAFEVVTADGRLLRASETEHSDLFWGLRGGGGSFGVITAMEIQLYPVSTVYGGNAIYPAELAREVLTRYRDWIASAPDELSSGIALMNFPPLPIVPEFLRGRSVIIVHGCYCGPVEQGKELFRTWNEWTASIDNTFRVMPFSEVGTISNDPVDPLPSFNTGGWLRSLNDEAIDTLIRHGVAHGGPTPLVMTEVRHIGGAMARVDRQANAFGFRDATLLLNLVGAVPTPEARSQMERLIGQFTRDLEPHLTEGVYINFLEGEEKWRRTREAYPSETYRRLVALKAKYDPDNLFRFSFGIPPAGDESQDPVR